MFISDVFLFQKYAILKYFSYSVSTWTSVSLLPLLNSEYCILIVYFWIKSFPKIINYPIILLNILYLQNDFFFCRLRLYDIKKGLALEQKYIPRKR